MKERAIITPGLIRQVQLMLAGGATGKEVAEITGTSEGTISRIKKAGFDYEQFQKNTEARRKPVPEPNNGRISWGEAAKISEEMDKQKRLELQGGVDYQVKVNEELPGQIGMDLQPEKPAEMIDQVKLMRFLAGQGEKIIGQMLVCNDAQLMSMGKTNEAENMIVKTMAQIDMKLSRIADYLGQILRVIGPEGGKRG